MISTDMFFASNDNGGRRSGYVRRTFSYTVHIPERRKDQDRRSGQDRRKPIASAEGIDPKIRVERRAVMR
jgi:hypothetical protein